MTLECVDRDRVVVYSAPETWPFLDTDGGTVEPHVHVGMPRGTLDRVARCSLLGTDPPLEGERR